MGTRVRAAGAAGVLAAAVLLAGCSAGDSGSSGSRAADHAAVAPAAAGDAKAAAGDGGKATAGAGGAGAGAAPSAGATGQPTDRRIAYQARMTVKVDALDPARDKAVDLATKAGGYVASESRRGAGEGAEATLTLKVPSDSYQQTLDALGGLGLRLALSSQADDLTGQIADVDSRVKSMRASVDRVRALMADAKTLAEVVSLESELTRREADLEALERQQQTLTARTSLSTVTLELLTDAQRPTGATTKSEEGFWSSIATALAGGWHALRTALHVLLLILAAGAPFLLVLTPAAWLLHRHYRRRTHPRTPAPTQED
ncbi:DUF4349 domain-containing protein [Kitasatospora sp. NPDC004531]